VFESKSVDLQYCRLVLCGCLSFMHFKVSNKVSIPERRVDSLDWLVCCLISRVKVIILVFKINAD